MKKIYLSPAIETLEVRATFAICEGSVGGGPGTDNDNNPSQFAPGRKPF